MAQHEAGVPLETLRVRHGIARPVLSRWWRRYQEADLAGLQPRSRHPHGSPTQHRADLHEPIDVARDFGWGVQRIADEVGVGHGTVQRCSGRAATGCRAAPRRPVRRYEKTRPGVLLYVDLKHLPALGPSPEFEYAAIDDFSREGLAVAGERSTVAATRFLEHVLTHRRYRVEALMPDNDMIHDALCALRDAFDAVRECPGTRQFVIRDSNERSVRL